MGCDHSCLSVAAKIAIPQRKEPDKDVALLEVMSKIHWSVCMSGWYHSTSMPYIPVSFLSIIFHLRPLLRKEPEEVL